MDTIIQLLTNFHAQNEADNFDLRIDNQLFHHLRTVTFSEQINNKLWYLLNYYIYHTTHQNDLEFLNIQARVVAAINSFYRHTAYCNRTNAGKTPENWVCDSDCNDSDLTSYQDYEIQYYKDLPGTSEYVLVKWLGWHHFFKTVEPRSNVQDDNIEVIDVFRFNPDENEAMPEQFVVEQCTKPIQVYEISSTT